MTRDKNHPYDPSGVALSIKFRQRRGRLPETLGAYTTWAEWQVKQGRAVISRHDTEIQARNACAVLLGHRP